jgi:cellulose synthase/poly-beta-1,6-N-acetylglucosamine synthase-like glycosyltransferase
VKRGDWTPLVGLVIVAHNEEGTIREKLRDCLATDYPPDLLEICVASDGSTDHTVDVVRSFSDRGVRLLDLPGPRGKAAALNEAVKATDAEVLVLCDARQRLESGAVRALVACLADATVGAVSGELHIDPAGGSGAAEGVGAYWTYEKVVRRLQSRLDSTVGVTGAIYAVRRDLFRPLDPETILDDVAVPMEVIAAGRRVVFEPAARAWDVASRTSGTEFRRKVRTLAGNLQVVALKPWLLDPRRNRLLLHLVSHKLARLAVPWALITVLGGSAVLAGAGSPWYALALAAQLFLYSAAALGSVAERAGLRFRALSVPYAFVLLNLAALIAPFRYLAGREGAAWKATAP